MSDNTPRLTFSRADRIGRLTMSAPAQRNAINLAWCGEFADAVRTCLGDPELRVILLQAEGDFFSVGGDITEFVAKKAELQAHVRVMAESFHDSLLALHRGPLPFVAAVAGMAAGGGLSLALSADIVLAARSARFVSAYTASGLSVDGGLSYTLPRLVGLRKSFELMALNPTLSADEAARIGLVNQVHDDKDFPAAIEACLQRLAATPPAALAALKRLQASSLISSLPQQLDAEVREISTLAGDPRTIAMLDAFMARRRGN